MLERIIIADTTCLITLTRINRIEILRKLYSEIHITSEVKREFGEPLPDWITIKDPMRKDLVELISMNLDIGEATAISLAIENENSLLIIDERKGRKVAKALGLNIIGLLGILIRAKRDHLISSISEILEELELADFRISESLKATVLELANEK